MAAPHIIEQRGRRERPPAVRRRVHRVRDGPRGRRRRRRPPPARRGGHVRRPRREHAGVVRYDAAQDHYDAANLSLIARAAPRHRRRRARAALPAQGRAWRTGRSTPSRRWSAGSTRPWACSTRTGSSRSPSRPTSSTGSPTWVVHRAIADICDLGVSARRWRSTCRRATSAGQGFVELRSRTELAASRRARRAAHRRDHRDRAARRPGRRHRGPGGASTPSGSGSASTTSAAGRPRSATCPRCRSHELKIDKSFVRDMLANPRARRHRPVRRRPRPQPRAAGRRRGGRDRRRLRHAARRGVRPRPRLPPGAAHAGRAAAGMAARSISAQHRGGLSPRPRAILGGAV